MTELEDLQVVWPTRSRSGSQFVVQLTTAVLGKLQPQSRINGSRREGYRADEKSGDFHTMFGNGDGYEYLATNGIRALKYEDPGKDDFIDGLLLRAPDVRFVASYRPIEDVISSHYNIKTWGHSEADVLYQFSACLSLYERLADAGRMFLINVEDKEQFELEKFARFLGVKDISSQARTLVSAWTPINDLRYQVERDSSQVFRGRRVPPRLHCLRSIHDWIPVYEERYLSLCANNGGDEN